MGDWAVHAGTEDAPPHLTCEPLARDGLRHAFLLKDGLPGKSPAPSPTVLRALGLPALPACRPAQVHGALVARPGREPASTIPRQADAVLIRDFPACAAIATADCVGGIIHSEETGAFAVVHAGWRGTLAGVLAAAIEALARDAASPPGSLRVALGPSIGGCCYEVGDDVAGRFRSAFGGGLPPEAYGLRRGKPTLDLAAANRWLAIRSGVPAARIHLCGICTACRQDLCWSYRVSGKSAGRMWTVAGRLAGKDAPLR